MDLSVTRPETILRFLTFDMVWYKIIIIGDIYKRFDCPHKQSLSAVACHLVSTKRLQFICVYIQNCCPLIEQHRCLCLSLHVLLNYW